MKKVVASPRVIKFAVLGLLVAAFAVVVFLPTPVLADGNNAGPKVAVEQMANRPGFQGNPWARAQPSCSSNRYYSNNPQRRPNYRNQYNYQPQRVQPRYVQQPRRTQPRYAQQPRYVPQQPRYDRHWDNNNWDNNHWDNDCGGFTYVVRRGDTLSSIARHYGISEWALGNANGVRNPNRIYEGQSLHIPSGYCR